MSSAEHLQPECIDPKVGDRVLGLRSGEISRGLSEESRRQLEAHVDICVFCRLTVDLEAAVAAAISDGLVSGPSSAPARSRRVQYMRLYRWSLGAAIAASLASLLLLPPRPMGPDIAGRGEDSPHFLSPVEGQVVRAGNLKIAWSDIRDAESYTVQLSTLDGENLTRSSAKHTGLVLSDDVGLVVGERYRLLLSTTPSDLLPLGAVSVGFEVGKSHEILGYRVRQAHPLLYVFSFLSLVLVVLYTRARARFH